MSTHVQKNTEILRVNIDDLVDEYPGGTFITLQGKPFTGIGFEMTDDGHMIREVTYIEGIENGPERSWHWNGKLESEGESKWNRCHGFFKEWYESGKLKAEGLIELGCLIWRKEWDEESNLISNYKIEEHPSRLEDLRATRIWAKNREPSYINLSIEHE
jgi:antitoxin component YwqK of YwqJK toxin-antitoxin module